jgi:hypothetical protein
MRTACESRAQAMSNDTIDGQDSRLLDVQLQEAQLREAQQQEAQLTAELARLRQEHRDLDAAIDALEGMTAADQLQIQRLKKRKLYLKDRIIALSDQMTPDIIA